MTQPFVLRCNPVSLDFTTSNVSVIILVLLFTIVHNEVRNLRPLTSVLPALSTHLIIDTGIVTGTYRRLKRDCLI